LEIERISYDDAFELQKKLVSARLNNEIEDTLLLLEHDPVFTANRKETFQNILVPSEILDQEGIQVCRTDRGGDVTYHGPGQVVGYSIMDLKEQGRDLHRYIRNVEQVLIDTLREYGIEAGRDTRHPGVWVGREKIAAIGIAVKNGWITMHGFALNADPNMNHFKLIVPCGITDKGVTSMAALLGRPVDRGELNSRLIAHYAEIFKRRPKKVAYVKKFIHEVMELWS
ncbi:MAG: lipoyl(octanoyl) transferase LipB, partial [Proteobacteria bacterium]|nr:lipoyl(octanoyl) transferase LipB [Pseudomonadota bacterium]